jgi:hypothetical protein
MIGGIEFNPVDLNSTYNRVEVNYPDSNIYDQNGFVYVDLDAEDRNPNEPDNVLQFALPFTNSNVTAQYIATRRLIQSREDLVVQVSLDYSGIQIDAGDLVRVNNAKFAWVDKVFRVTQVQEAKTADGFLGVSLTLSEYNPQVYQNISITQFIPQPNTGITDPNIATTPVAPTITNILNPASIPSFSLNATVPTQGTYGAIEFYYSDSTDSLANYVLLKTILPTGATTFTPGSIQSITVTGLIQDSYFFRVRMITTTGSKSGYSPAGPSNLGVPFAWNPSVSAPGQESVSLEWSPAAIIVPSASDGSNATVGQTARLRMYVGTNVANLWDGSNTQPNNSWYANNVVLASTGITASNLTYDTANNVVITTLNSMAANVDTGAITVANLNYKDSTGNITPVGTSQISVTKVKQGATGNTGNSGTQYNTAYLYQWSPTQPGNTSGNSTFDWTTGINSGYTGGNNWVVTAPSNPGTPGIRFWTASKPISAPGNSTTSVVDWNSNVTIFTGSQNGLNGTKTAIALVYQWSLPPAPTITGSSTYTWATGNISSIPSGWSQTPSSPPAGGFNLYAAEVNIEDATTANTSPINWTTARVYVTGYAGNNGNAAQILRMSSTTQIFTYDGTGNASPNNQVATFEAELQNISGSPTFTAFAEPGNVNITANLQTVNAFARNLTVANFGGYESATVTATAGTFSDQITIVRVSDGANGAAGNSVTGYLTNEAMTFAASTNGNIPSYAGGAGSFEVYRNLTRTNGTNTSFSVANQSNCVVTINTTTGAYTVQSMSDSANIASANLQVVYSGDTPSVTLTKTLSLSKSIAGANGANGGNGVNGTRTAVLDVYRWSTVTPTTFPSGNSVYTWSTAQFTLPPTPNGWSLTPGAGSSGQTLYLARQVYADTGTSGTSNIAWTTTTASIVGAFGANGVNGTRTAVLELYQWSVNSPTNLPSGNSTYTWSSGQFTAPGTPNGWTLTPGAVVAGSTLWGVKRVYADNSTDATTSISWTGLTGPYPVGAAGTVGAPGISARICFARFGSTILNPTSGTITTTGTTSVPSQTQSNSIWGLNTTWNDGADPNPNSTLTLWISDGVYNPTSNQTTWSTPYIASLRVGQLSAITINTGNLNADGNITVSNLGSIKGGQTDFDTGNGFFLGYSGGTYKFSVGSATNDLIWNGTSLSITGNITGNSNIVISGTASFSGNTSTTSPLGGLYPLLYSTIVANNTGNTSCFYGTTHNNGTADGAPYAIWGRNQSTLSVSAGVHGTSAGGAGVLGSSTGSTGYGGRFTASVAGQGLYASGIQVPQTGQIRWLTSSGGYGSEIVTDGNDALRITSGASGSTTAKAIIFGVYGGDICRVARNSTNDVIGSLRPERDAPLGGTIATPIADLGAFSFQWNDVWCVNLNQSSDTRYKNLANVYLGLDFITNLEPISYTWREGGRVHQGLSAQQVHQTVVDLGLDPGRDFAGWVQEDPEDPESKQALRYTEFIGPLINAVRELSAQVNELKAEIAKLKGNG